MELLIGAFELYAFFMFCGLLIWGIGKLFHSAFFSPVIVLNWLIKLIKRGHKWKSVMHG